jgi:hypothetical protein
MATPPHNPHETPPPDASRGHEYGDLPLKGIVIFVISMIICTILIQWGVSALMRNTSRDNRQQDTAASPLLLRDASGKIVRDEPPGPLIQPFSPEHSDLPYQDLVKMRAQNQSILSTYGAAPSNPDDPTRARIPIDRAIQLLTQQGLHEEAKP